MPMPVETVPASIKFSLCQPKEPLQSKGTPDSLGLSQYTGVCSEEPGSVPRPRPCHLFCPSQNGSLSFHSLSEVTLPLSPCSHTHPLQLLHGVCLFQTITITSHPRHSVSVFMPAPVCKTFHCPKPFLLSCSCHTCPLRLASDKAGYNPALPVSFSPSPRAPWHTSRLWGSLWDPLVYVFLISP